MSPPIPLPCAEAVLPEMVLAGYFPRREGARVEALVRQYEHVAIGGEDAQLDGAVAVEKELAGGDGLSVVDGQRLKSAVAVDGVGAVQHQQLAAGHDGRVRRKVVVQVGNRYRGNRAGQSIGCADAQSRRPIAHDGQSRALPCLVTHQQGLAREGRARPVGGQRRDASRNGDRNRLGRKGSLAGPGQ